jgi:protein-S-isoprenylcysteine O-methyltransferase Ste14
MARFAAFIYGVVCYVIFFLTFLYLVAFLGDLGVPRSVGSGAQGPLGQALLVNAALLALFSLQHSVMARPGFKAWLTRIVPRPVERSTYVLASSLVLILLFWQWRPMTGVVWQVDGAVGRVLLYGFFFVGVTIVLYATCLISHFDLFGLRQVFLYLRGERYAEKRFMTPSLYKFIRHPLYVGWFVTVWATPLMTTGHLLFAVVATGYILSAIPFEERDLSKFLGEEYRRYRERTPMFVPRIGRLRPQPVEVETRLR